MKEKNLTTDELEQHIPKEIEKKWQEIVDIIAEIMGVSAALVVRLMPTLLEILASNASPKNPFHKGKKFNLNTGLYCEWVMKHRQKLLIPDARNIPEWSNAPAIEQGMVSYLGFPLCWPNGEIFGTICLLDNKNNSYSPLYEKLVKQFKEVIETDLQHISTVAEKQKQSEAEIRYTRAYLESILNNSLDLIFTVKKDGTFGYINSRVKNVTGYRQEEIWGRHFIEFIPEHRKEFMLKKWEEINNGISGRYETEIIKADGTLMHCLVSHSIIEGFDEILVALQDITERKQMEEILQFSARRFAKIFHYSPSLIGISSLTEGRLIDVNDTFLRISGYQREEVIGRNTVELGIISKEARDKMLQLLLKDGGAIHNMELEYHVKSGNVRVGLYSAVIIELENKQCLLSILTDITETKQIEINLQKQEHFLTSIFESIQDGISILDNELNIIRVNSTMERWYSHSMPLEGKKCYKAYHQRSEPCEICPTRKTIETGAPAFDIVPIRDINGKIIGWVDLYTFPLIDFHTGKTTGVIEYVRNITDRRKTENILKQREQFLSSIFNSIQDGLTVINTDLTIISINPTVKRWYPYIKTFEGRKCYEVFHKRKEPCEKCPTIRTITTGKSDYEIVEWLDADGKIAGQLEIYTYPFFDLETGKTNGVIEYVHDITEQKKAEEEIQIAEERFRIAAKSVSDLIYEWDISSGRLEWFGDIDKNLGYARGEFPRTMEAWEHIVHPDDYNRVMETVNRHLETRTPYYEEYRVIRKDGGVIYWTDSGTALWDKKGKAYKWIGVITDITDRKCLEEALIEANEKFNAIIQASPLPILSIDLDGRITSWNAASEQVFGWAEIEVLGQFLPIVPEDRKKEFYSLLGRVLQGETLTNVELIRQKKDGSLLDVTLSTSLLYNAAGNPVGIMAILADITEKKRLEQERINFLSGISHELKTPLVVISGYTKTLLEENLPTRIKNKLQIIDKRALQEIKLVEELISLSILDHKKLVYKMVDINLCNFLKDYFAESKSVVSTLIQRRFKTDNFVFKCDISQDVENIIIYGDKERIKQSLDNLIENAIKYSDSNRLEFNITAKLKNKFVEIGVLDKGIGIPIDEQNKIFKPFYQIRKGKYPLSDGIGMGLSLIEEYIKAHGGEMHIESEPGQGSTFYFSLPVKYTE